MPCVYLSFIFVHGETKYSTRPQVQYYGLVQSKNLYPEA